jgi:hypothetical protein
VSSNPRYHSVEIKAAKNEVYPGDFYGVVDTGATSSPALRTYNKVHDGV